MAAVPKFVEGEDIGQYLTTFERLAAMYMWPREDWAVYLVPYLTGKARTAYVAMDSHDSLDYGKVKEAILESDIQTSETPKELYHRLKDLFRKWIRPEQKTVEEIAETLILEQFLRTLAPDIRVWVKEHKPKTGQHAAEQVENFLSA